ncbi:MAG: radical SAM protein [Planctomycetes bacterium]|nr:radical SAM protein [Planctomycetota bacterium]
MKKRVLLVCPHSALQMFSDTKVSIGICPAPYVSLAVLAAVLLAHGHSCKIVDLSISSRPEEEFVETLENYVPDFVGITFTSCICDEAGFLARKVKEYDSTIVTISGGVHTSIFPLEAIEKLNFDFAVFGEGEYTLLELVSGHEPSKIDGLAYRNREGKVVVNKPRALIADLDEVPYPALFLYDSTKYHAPRVIYKNSPVAAIETSRGCSARCVYCYCANNSFNHTVRTKSAKRVVDEMEMVLNLGYKEIHIWDDSFSGNMEHAKAVCDEIIRRKLRVCWNVYNGIRVNRVDEELLIKLKESGCYSVSFGIESGDKTVLNATKKGVNIEQMKRASLLCKKVGIKSMGFYMIGLPGETPETVGKTIELAKELDFDYHKVAIATPLPGTEYFDKLDKKGLIRSYEWSDYVFHSKKRVAEYPGLNDDIYHYYNLFWRKLYLNPRFINRRIWSGLKTGRVFLDTYFFFKVLFRFKW